MSDFVFATAIYQSGDWESAQKLPSNLIDSVARYTSIQVRPTGVNVSLANGEIFNYPFVWFTGHLPVRFTDRERANLKQYVERGGFVMMDDHNHDLDGVYHKTATEELVRTFGPLKTVPKSHAIYNCFFNFSDGPPATSHELNGWGDNLVHKELQAVMTGGGDRIGLLYSSKDYSSEWDFEPESKKFMAVDPTRFGVNLIVYALTR
ncbi:MAG: DUF4159 domain-containing protein [Gemmatimonadota bacterium]|nr:DUF4159 domain-containing protein [Gemmatimonadota bacterium]